MKIIEERIILKHPFQKQVFQRPADCPGPLESTHCNYTWAMTGTGTAWAQKPRIAAAETTSVGGKPKHLRRRWSISVPTPATSSWCN